MNIEGELEKIEKKIQDAQERAGDSEICDAMLEKAECLQRNGRSEEAIKVYEEASTKLVGVGRKIDIYLSIVGIVSGKGVVSEEFKSYLDKCAKMMDEGGDWERRNKLKMYQGVYALARREFTSAAKDFVEIIPSYNCPDLLSFETLVIYSILTSIVTLSRTEISAKILKSAEIKGVQDKIKLFYDFIEHFYECRYKEFFKALCKPRFFHFDLKYGGFKGTVDVAEWIGRDRYLGPHRALYMREIRVVVYSQFLESYKTVSLENMAAAFGVTADFIDSELCELISMRRINCKIDKVANIIELERADPRNRLYQETLKQVDMNPFETH